MRTRLFGHKIKIVAIVFTVVLCLCAIAFGGVYLYKLANRSTDFDVNKIEIMQGENVLSSLSTEVFGEDIYFSLRLNDGTLADNVVKPKITWEFVGDNLNCSLVDSTFCSGDTIGDVKLQVTVESRNSMSATLPITITEKQGSVLQTMTAKLNENCNNSYIEGQRFDKSSISLCGCFGDYEAYISDFEIEEDVLSSKNTEIHINYKDLSCYFAVSVSNKKLQSIELNTPSTKTTYVEGQIFDKTGLTLKLNYEYVSEITDVCYFSILPLTFGTQEIEIFYMQNGIAFSTSQQISVEKRELIYLGVDTENVKTEYTHGDKFLADGLKVYAVYKDLGGVEIDNYSFDTKNLEYTDEKITISYTENGITKTIDIDICVYAPYGKTRQIRVENPIDVDLSWTYSYMNESKKIVIDNLTYEQTGLLYDRLNGIYEVPVGARVVVEATNPVISDLLFDGVKQQLNYPNIIKTFDLTSGNELVITQSILANKIVIRFIENLDKKETFAYGKSWNSPLSDADYKKLELLFKDSEKYYYSYKIGENTYTYEQLKTVIFYEDTTVVVSKKQKENSTIKLALNTYLDVFVDIDVEKTAKVSELPKPQRDGYVFLGWSLTLGGEVIDDEMLSEYLSYSDISHTLYSIWELEVIDYSSEEIIGTWIFEQTVEDVEYSSTITFNSNATFSYEVKVDGVLNNSCQGLYRIEDGEIVVINIIDSDNYYASNSSFEFCYNQTLSCNLLVVFEDGLGVAFVEYSKV